MQFNLFRCNLNDHVLQIFHEIALKKISFLNHANKRAGLGFEVKLAFNNTILCEYVFLQQLTAYSFIDR